MLPIYGASLPDDWRDAVSFRRLLVVFRHADPDSPMHVALRGRRSWTVTHQLIDDVRRTVQTVATHKETPPSHLSPHAHKPVDNGHLTALADAKQRAEQRRKELG